VVVARCFDHKNIQNMGKKKFHLLPIQVALTKEESGGLEQNSSGLCESLEIAAVTRLGNSIASRPFG
jgi:hypothetical protein